MSTAATTTMTYVTNSKVACAFSLPTVLASGTLGLYSFDVPKTGGRIVQIDAALAGSGVATVSIFSKDGLTTGSLYEMVKVTGLTTSYHVILNRQSYLNAEATPVAKLYINVTETGGAVATGIMTFIVWIEA